MLQFVSTAHKVTFATLWCAGFALAAPKTIDVNCGSNDTISGALEKADPGDTIRISGVCNEKITIRTDRVTLTGLAGAVIQGGSVQQGVELDGLVTIDGARGVVIRNLTIQRSRAEGIFGTRGAAFAVENVTLQDNGGSGLGSASSIIDVSACTSRLNSSGFDLFNGTQAVFRGNIVASDNQIDGIFLGGTSSFEVRGAKIEANNNGGGAVAIGSQISFWTFGGTQTTGGSINASGNHAVGIRLIDSGMEVFSDAATVTATGNPTGLILNGGVFSAGPPGTGIRVVLENNGVGFDAEGRSIAVVIGGLNVRGNTTTGILADDSSLILVSPPRTHRRSPQTLWISTRASGRGSR
jgi:hypothetical protein